MRNRSGMTLDLYGHLSLDQLDEVGDRLDAAARACEVYLLCTDAEVLNFEQARRTLHPRKPGGIDV